MIGLKGVLEQKKRDMEGEKSYISAGGRAGLVWGGGGLDEKGKISGEQGMGCVREREMMERRESWGQGRKGR